MIRYEGVFLKPEFKKIKKSKSKEELEKKILQSKIDFLENSISLNRKKIQIDKVKDIKNNLKQNIILLKTYIKYLKDKNKMLNDNLYITIKNLDDNEKTLVELEKCERKLNNKVYKKLKKEDNRKKSKNKLLFNINLF